MKNEIVSRSPYSSSWQRNVNDTPISIFSTFKIQQKKIDFLLNSLFNYELDQVH